jgi:hypothetical protein
MSGKSRINFVQEQEMSLYLRVIQSSDLEEILEFEQAKLRETVVDEDERIFAAWHSRWRKESLEHYIPMGWSFLARDRNMATEQLPEGPLVGYFLAQPLLFFAGQTQSLWVEHMQFQALQARDELCELAYRLSREKHFQKVLFPESATVMNAVKSFKPTNWNPQVLSVASTKAST